MKTSRRRYTRAFFCIAILAAGLAVTVRPDGVSAATAAPDCGAKIKKSIFSYWKCTFADEFDGTTLNTAKWTVQATATSGYHSGSECFFNNAGNVSVAAGHLTLTVRDQGAPFVCHSPSGDYVTRYTSGMVSTFGTFAQKYGRFEVRAKLPAAAVAGLQESFWLWPVNPVKYGPWPYSGEVDFAEIYSKYPDRAIPYIHYVPATVDVNVTNNSCLISNIAQFHTYTVEWTSAKFTVKYDGATCLSDSWNPASPLHKPQPFDQPFLLALTQALGIGANAFDPATTPLPASTQIDYVHVWS